MGMSSHRWQNQSAAGGMCYLHTQAQVGLRLCPFWCRLTPSRKNNTANAELFWGALLTLPMPSVPRLSSGALTLLTEQRLLEWGSWTPAALDKSCLNGVCTWPQGMQDV